MQPWQLHGVLWSAEDGAGAYFTVGETSLESQTARGDGWKGRGGRREERRDAKGLQALVTQY